MHNSSAFLRNGFLNFFRQRQHAILPSSPVAAKDDPTLFFTNAGMNQFKDQFLGKSPAQFPQIATCQACLRAGGKHNDLDMVGLTPRHLTLFEMLGNFSFGAYFKREAIDFAWELVTEVFQLDPDRLFPTVLIGDDETAALWEAHVPPTRISRLPESENFWSMGPTGPCGPCSELYYDRGVRFGEFANPAADLDGNRFVEIWNLVFMQSNQLADGAREPLPRPMIDTGAGLERIAWIKQGVESVFETDLIQELVADVAELDGKGGDAPDLIAARRVIADHLRALSFAIADGVEPSNVDRGYVVRKLIRRAVRFGRTLGLNRPFLAKLLPTVLAGMGQAYPNLTSSAELIASTATAEEEGFLRALIRAERQFHSFRDHALAERRAISGQEVFTLKDTYGLPYEEIESLARASNIAIDRDQVHAFELRARELSKSAEADAKSPLALSGLERSNPTPFVGYQTLHSSAQVELIFCDGEFRQELNEGQRGWIALSESPFYAERGGQIGDSGELFGSGMHFEVHDCHEVAGKLIAHEGLLKSGHCEVGSQVIAQVDAIARLAASRCHTATHLLHWAIGTIIEQEVRQAGSLVARGRLRLDVHLPKPLSAAQLEEVEDRVNACILANDPIITREIPYETARQDPQICQLFEDKYGAVVRVVESGPTQVLCGGTHAQRTGDLGYFRIVRESGIAAGIRRVEAVVGPAAQEWVKRNEKLLFELIQGLKATPETAQERLTKLLQRQAELQASQSAHMRGEIRALARSLSERAERVMNPRFPAGFSLLIESVEQCELKQVGEAIEKLLPTSVIALAQMSSERCVILLQVSGDLEKCGLFAKDLWEPFAKRGFRGRGRNTLAQGAGIPLEWAAASAELREMLTAR